MKNADNAAERVGHKIGKAIRALPEGYDTVVFLLLDQGATFDCTLVASLPPKEFVPVIRRWLERYDAGEATGFMVPNDA